MDKKYPAMVIEECNGTMLPFARETESIDSFILRIIHGQVGS
jgi:hypothetical protein